MITEIEYLDAIATIKQYAEQIKNQTEEVLLPEVLTKTPREIGGKNWKIYFPTMCFRLKKIIVLNFEDTRICDITKKSFYQCTKQAGKGGLNYAILLVKNGRIITVYQCLL